MTSTLSVIPFDSLNCGCSPVGWPGEPIKGGVRPDAPASQEGGSTMVKHYLKYALSTLTAAMFVHVS